MSDHLFLDVDFETARAIHRVARGMHDGECPRCHILFNSTDIRTFGGWGCPNCGFFISEAEMSAAMKSFAPIMERNLELFEAWRKNL